MFPPPIYIIDGKQWQQQYSILMTIIHVIIKYILEYTKEKIIQYKPS